MMSPLHAIDYELIIKEQHLDTFGHVNNATYLVLLEEARWDLITRGGFGLQAIQERKIGPVLLEIQMKFIKELRLRQKIIIRSQFVAYERKIGVMTQNILNEAQEICFESKIHFGLFDMHTRKLISPTQEWLRAIGA